MKNKLKKNALWGLIPILCLIAAYYFLVFAPHQKAVDSFNNIAQKVKKPVSYTHLKYSFSIMTVYNERRIIMEKKVHFKLHKVKKHWVTIAVTGLALGLSFAGLSYASAEEQPTPCLLYTSRCV